MLRYMLISLNKTQLFLLHESEDGQRQASWRIWVLIFVLPVLFILASVVLAYDSYSFVKKAEKTTGEVVHVYAWDGWNPWDGATIDYSPVFRYRFSEAEITEASTGQSSPNWNHQLGSKHEILFNPEYKTNVKQNNFEQLWALPSIIAVMGLILLMPSLLAGYLVLRWLNKGADKITADDW